MTEGAQQRSRREPPEVSLQEEVERRVEELAIGARRYVFRPEPRCRVCQHDEISRKVNHQLALGRSYANVLRDIEGLLDELEIPEDARPSYQSIYSHGKKHFAIDNGAQAIYREILERRALETSTDYVTGVANIISPLAYLETVMVKGYEAMQSGVQIDPEMGMKAAERLHSIAKGDEQQADSAQLMAQMNRIIEAVRAVVPVEYWDKIVARLDGVDAEVEDLPELEDPAYAPGVDSIDEGDPDVDG